MWRNRVLIIMVVSIIIAQMVLISVSSGIVNQQHASENIHPNHSTIFYSSVVHTKNFKNSINRLGIDNIVLFNSTKFKKESENIRYVTHSRFKIDGNDEFKHMAQQENWSGNGTRDNPYIIENYSINANHNDYGIFIKNTSVYFIIRNNYIYNAELIGSFPNDYNGSGIILYNVTHGAVINNTLAYDTTGIYLVKSAGNIIKDNKVINKADYADGGGICLKYSSYNIIENNTISGNMYLGIYLYDSHKNIFYSNNFTNSSIFLDEDFATLTSQIIPTNNTVQGKPIYYIRNITTPTTFVGPVGGLIIVNTSNINVENVVITNTSYSVEIGESNNITILNMTNIGMRSSVNLYIFKSKNITIDNGNITASGAGVGIEIYYGNNVKIINSSLKFVYLPNGIGGDDLSDYYSKSTSVINSYIDNLYYYNPRFSSFYNSTIGDLAFTYGENVTAVNDTISSYSTHSSQNISIENCLFEHHSNPVEIESSSHIKIENNRFEEGSGNAVELDDSSYAVIKDNVFFGYNHAIYVHNGPSTTHDYIIYNFISWSTSYGIYIGGSTGGTEIYGNSFFYNNGSNDTYNSSHIQAYEGYANTWNTGSMGNFWSDWTTPDNDHDGIVDNPYVIAPGSAWIYKDFKPLANATYPLIGKILNVKNGDILTGPFNYTIWGRDYNGTIKKIEWYINNTKVNTSYPQSNNVTLTWYWDTTSYKDGDYSISGILYDDHGRIFKTSRYTVTVDNTPPSVNITEPNNSTELRSVVAIVVNASDGSGSGISEVDFYLDGTLQYKDTTYPYIWEWDTTKFGNGKHQVKVVAIDNAGFTSLDVKNYTVYNILIPHAPIKINNDTDFYNIALEENWSGNGTREYPFYIDMYLIDAHNSSPAIYIGNTTVYFVIRNCVLFNTSMDASGDIYKGSTIELYNVKNGYIVNNTLLNSEGEGMFLYNSKDTIIENNTIKNYRGLGVEMYSSTNITMIHNTIENVTATSYFTSVGILYVSSTYILLKNNTCVDTGVGIYSYFSTYSRVYSNTLVKGSIYLLGYSLNQYASHNITSNNTVNSKPVYYYKNQNMSGFFVPQDAGEVIAVNITNLNISNLNISNATIGVEAPYDVNLKIDNNRFYNLMFGVEYLASQNVYVENNTFENVGYGVNAEAPSKIANNNFEDNFMAMLISSYPNTITSNTMVNCSMLIQGDDVKEYVNQTITTDNTVNGKPVYYYKNKNLQNQILPNDAGEIILANVSNAIIFNTTFSNATLAIELGYTTNITVKNVSIMNQKYYGLYMASSSKVRVENSYLLNNSNGIYIGGDGDTAPSENIITSCNISNNIHMGVYIDWGDSNIIVNNTITYNGEYGVYILFGENNMIYRNIFSHNNGAGDTYNSSHIQAKSDDGPNYWYNPDLKLGNYWYDWANNNDTNDQNPQDGIVDWPYKIDGYEEEEDLYPLKNKTFTTAPSAPLNLKATVGDGYVNLTWDPPANDGGSPVKDYKIYKNNILIDVVPSSQRWYNDTKVQNGVTYKYYVTAENDVGESSASNSVTATPGAAVPEIYPYAIPMLILTVAFIVFLKRHH